MQKRLTREEYKKQKELEELRKQGVAPPQLDESGVIVNPHIPAYVSNRPWYVVKPGEEVKPGLKHQYAKHWGKQSESRQGSEGMAAQWYSNKGSKGKKATAYRKGACTNCGAMTHKTRDCVERPRRRGAKLTNVVTQADEIVEERPNLDFDGKRDRYNGYNPAQYSKVIKHFEKAEAVRRKMKEAELEKKMQEKRERRRKRREERAAAGAGSDSDSDSDDDEDDDERRELADTGEVIQKFDSSSRTSVRNLRIREDTAKYLRNLDVNSAHYDPKTRTMRANPHPEKDPKDLLFAGDNFVRHTGEAKKVTQLQSFVYKAGDHGNEEINIMANPSQAEKMFQSFKSKKSNLKAQQKSSILDRYGGQQHLKAPAKELLYAQSNAYVEYDEDGSIINGQEEVIPSTKYLEDVFEKNHTSVWGSYWQGGKWGYACCHQLLRNAYCTGKQGIEASKEIKESMEKRARVRQDEEEEEVKAVPAAQQASSGALSGISFSGSAVGGSKKRKKAKKHKKQKRSSSSGSDEDDDDEESEEGKKKRRMRGLKEGEEVSLSGLNNSGLKKNKRGYNVNYDSSVPTEEEMEEYRKTQTKVWDDPLSKMKDTID